MQERGVEPGRDGVRGSTARDGARGSMVARGRRGLAWALLLAATAVATAGGDEGGASPANETADELADKLPVTRPRVRMASAAAKRMRGAAVNAAMAGDCAQAIVAFRQFVDTDWATADDFNNFAVCLQQEGRREEALEEFEEGIKRFYHSEKLHQNLGLLLEELANEDFLQGRGGEPDAAAAGNRATTHLTFAMRLQLARLWEKHSATVPKQDRIGLGRKTVAIFCRPRNLEGLNEGVWGPSLVLQDGARPEHGEDAVIFLSRHLVKLGFNVEVYANMPKGDVGMDKFGVMWRPFYALHAMLPPVWNGTHVLWPKLPSEKMPDVFISWQNLEGAQLYNSSVYTARNITPPASYLWLHDVVDTPSQLTPWFMGPLHGIILMSRFHAAMTPARVSPCVRITHACIEQVRFVPGTPYGESLPAAIRMCIRTRMRRLARTRCLAQDLAAPRVPPWQPYAKRACARAAACLALDERCCCA